MRNSGNGKSDGGGVHSIVVGDHNVRVVGKTNIVGKFLNRYSQAKAETFDQRNRRIMLDHVENFWIKGVLEKSLHGMALLELGIKEDPSAIRYPWTIKNAGKEEILPIAITMPEVFQEIGLGRSLLILGAPGSGKTTMLLELARWLIERARQDGTEPIPVVFNLATWTERYSLAGWLERELNTIYNVPRKIALSWINGSNMLLLLDGLDELPAESRQKCVDVINQFKKEYGLTGMVVCSRTQDYAAIKTRLIFDGAIEIQPLTSAQVSEYFRRFGNEMSALRKALEENIAFREMGETPLFLNLITLAYRNTSMSASPRHLGNRDAQRKYLYDAYIQQMFQRTARTKNEVYAPEATKIRLSWLAKEMMAHNQFTYLVENMQPTWLSREKQEMYNWIAGLTCFWIGGLVYGLIYSIMYGLTGGLIGGLIGGLVTYTAGKLIGLGTIKMVDILSWDWKQLRRWSIVAVIVGAIVGLIIALIVGTVAGLIPGLITGLIGGLGYTLSYALSSGLSTQTMNKTTYPGQRIFFSMRNSFIVVILCGLIGALIGGLIGRLSYGLNLGISIGLSLGLFFGLRFGGLAALQHYTLRLMLVVDNLLPWRIIPFLDYCTDLIFLRRVGGGYIFVHRLLMEHFAAMYSETELAKSLLTTEN